MDDLLIDVWDLGTLGDALVDELQSHRELVQAYFDRDRANYAEKIEQPGLINQANEFAEPFLNWQEQFANNLGGRSIRAWHYTRMTDCELTSLGRDGVLLSTPAFLSRRLDALVERGTISQQDAREIGARSPFQTQLESRSNKFWLVSHPLAVDDHGVRRLLAYWGGEVASFHMDENDALLTQLNTIGIPRVVEMAVPLDATRQAYLAAKRLVELFGRSLGCRPLNWGAVDICCELPLGSNALLRIHSEGEPTFANMGLGYPLNYTCDSSMPA
jgi:hypothetical protein